MRFAELDNIRKKVRRLTKSPSEAQLETDKLDEYVNTVVLYDLPETLESFNLYRRVSLYLDPYVQEYDRIYMHGKEIKIKDILSIQDPVSLNGDTIRLFQDVYRFNSAYPHRMESYTVGTGDGLKTLFTGQVQGKIVPKDVLFSSIDVGEAPMEYIDYPEDAFDGRLLSKKSDPDTTPINFSNRINYDTGKFSVDFQYAVAKGEPVIMSYCRYVPSKPTAVLFNEDKLYFRHIPDKSYKVDFSARIRPEILLEEDDKPEVSAFWQYIALMSALKIFEDRLDFESIEKIRPMINYQQMILNRREIRIQNKQRAYTIYSEGLKNGVQ